MFAGNLSSVVTPDYVCDLLDRDVCRNVSARFFTSTSSYALRLDAYKNAGIARFGWIGPKELNSEMIEASQLLSIAEVGGRQMSSKIFGYISTGKPIVHVYYADDDVNVRYLKQYPLVLCLKADQEEKESNARLLALWCVWSFGQRMSWGDLVRKLDDLTPEFVAEKVLSVWQRKKGVLSE